MVYRCFGVIRTKTGKTREEISLIALIQDWLNDMDFSFSAKHSSSTHQILRKLGGKHSELVVAYQNDGEICTFMNIENITAIGSDRGALVFLIGERTETDNPEDESTHKCFTFLNFVFEESRGEESQINFRYTDDCAHIQGPIDHSHPLFI